MMNRVSGILLACIVLITFTQCVKTYPKIDLSQHKVLVDPFSVAPLTAIIQLNGPNALPKNVEKIIVKVIAKDDRLGNPGVEISDTLYPHSDIFKTHFFDITKDKKFKNQQITSENEIEIPVLGLYPDYKNKVFVELIGGKTHSSDTFYIQTHRLPDTTLTVEILKCNPKLMEPGDVTWMTADSYPYDLMFDKRGEVRWIIDVEGKSDLRVLKNGNLLIRSWWAERNFGEYTMLGESVKRWKLPKQFLNHHDIVEMPNGNLLVPVTYDKKRDEGYYALQDNIIELDRDSGEIVNIWDLFELLDIANLPAAWTKHRVWYKGEWMHYGVGDWFHMNSIAYDALKDEIIVSGKHGGVIKLSRNGENGMQVNANKQIIWYMPNYDQYEIYANHPATKKYILTAVNAEGVPYADQSLRYPDFHWTKFQHHPTITHTDEHSVQFLIFNNVYDEKRSAMVEYLVNEKEHTVQEVWAYGGNQPKLYAAAWSGAALLKKTDNRLMVNAFALNPKLEVTKGKIKVFEFLLHTDYSKPKWYRGGRIYLYPNGN